MAEGEGGALRELLAVFGFSVDDKGLKEGENRLGEFLDKVKTIGEGIAAAFAVEKLFEFAEGQVHAMTAVEHLAAQIGISTDAVQAWQFAAESAGFEADKFLNAMSRLQVAAGSGKGGKAFGELGISIKDSSGKAKDASALFTDVAEAVKKTEDPNKRAAIATKLFGRSGRELLPFLEEGKEGVDELMKAYKELGGAFNEKQIKQGKDFEKAQAGLNLTLKGLKATVAEVVIPIFTKLMKFATPIIHWFKEALAHSNAVKAALIVFGGIIAATVLPPLVAMAAAIAAPVAGFLLLIGLVDDLITMFSGGKSVIGSAIDKIWGKGASAGVVKELKDAWEGVKDVFLVLWNDGVKNVWDFFKWIVTHAGELGDALGDYFGKINVGAKTEGFKGAVGAAIGLPQSAPIPVPAIDANPFGSYRPSTAGIELAGPQAAGMAAAANGNEGDVHVHVTTTVDGDVIDRRHHKMKKAQNRATAATFARGTSGS